MVNWGQPVTNRTSISISLVLYLTKWPIPHEALFNLLECSLRKVISFIGSQFWIIFTIIWHLFLLWASSSGRNDGLWKETNTLSQKTSILQDDHFNWICNNNFWKKIPGVLPTQKQVFVQVFFMPEISCQNHYVFLVTLSRTRLITSFCYQLSRPISSFDR